MVLFYYLAHKVKLPPRAPDDTHNHCKGIPWSSVLVTELRFTTVHQAVLSYHWGSQNQQYYQLYKLFQQIISHAFLTGQIVIISLRCKR